MEKTVKLNGKELRLASSLDPVRGRGGEVQALVVEALDKALRDSGVLEALHGAHAGNV